MHFVNSKFRLYMFRYMFGCYVVSIMDMICVTVLQREERVCLSGSYAYVCVLCMIVCFVVVLECVCVCVCACVRACVRTCVRACVRACV